MAASITNSVSNTSATVIAVDWGGVDNSVYPSVRVDKYLTSILAKLKSGDPFPPVAASDNKGGINAPSTPPVDTVNGFPLPFTGLTPSTSYTFVLYGWYVDPDTGGAPLPIQLAISDPISTLAQSQPPKTPPQPVIDYPDLYPYPFPKDLNNTNRVRVTLGNPELFVQWYITVHGNPNNPNGIQDPNSIAPGGSYWFESSPGGAYTVSASGKLVSTGAYTNSPTKYQVGGPNSHSVQTFLSNSGVNGSNGIRQFLDSSKSASVRDMLGIML
jgi:hypothetical protein